MADYTYTGAEYAAPASGKIANMANWLGAAASIALVVGIGVWGYRVMARDVSGVPIVQAMSGPMRVAPKDPGGTLADHQGLAVNNVAGNGAAEGPADRLVLAPVPAGLSSEDVATGALMTQPVSAPVTTEAALSDAPTAALTEPAAPIQPAAAELDPIQILANQLADGAVPLSAVALSETAPKPVQDTSQDIVLASAVVVQPSSITEELAALARELPPGLERSLRPRVRPAALRTASLQGGLAAPTEPTAVAAAIGASEVRELAASSLPNGTRLVQIGIFNSPDAARKEWGKLDARFGDYLGDKDRVVQKAKRGGREFYRLRVHGFADLSDARRFCAAFMAQNVDCIPVVTK